MSPSRPRSIRDTFPGAAAKARAAVAPATDEITEEMEMATATGTGTATATEVAATRQRPPAGSKFTVILSPEDAATFDQLALDVRRRLGRRVVKGDLVRALVALAGDDATLRDQVVAELLR